MSSLYTIFLLYDLITLHFRGKRRDWEGPTREGRMDTEMLMLMLRRMLVMCDVYSAGCSCVLPAVVVVCLLY